MDDENFLVRDERGSDRSHIDNTLIRDYGWLIGAKTIGIYAVLLMHADKKQKCFPSIKRLEEITALSKPTVIESIKLLDWLRIIKSIQVGKQCTNRYILLDKRMWRKDWEVMLNGLTTGEVNIFNPSGKTILLQRLNHFTSIVTRPNSNKTQVTIVEAKAPTEWIFKDELEKLRTNEKRKDFKVIALYWKRKGFVFENQKQFSVALKRELRAANSLNGYSGEQLGKVMSFCQKEYPDIWTLETVVKSVPKVINKKP